MDGTNGSDADVRHRRAYEATIDETRSIFIGYDFDSDNYMLIGKNGDDESSLCLSQDAMWAIVQAHPLLLRYQSQCAPDGVGAEL